MGMVWVPQGDPEVIPHYWGVSGFWEKIPTVKSCGAFGGLQPFRWGATNQLGGNSRSCSVSKCPTWNAFAWTLWGPKNGFHRKNPNAVEMRWCQSTLPMWWGGVAFFSGEAVFFLIGRYIIDRYIISVKWELCTIDLWFMMIYVTNEKNTCI